MATVHLRHQGHLQTPRTTETPRTPQTPRAPQTLETSVTKDTKGTLDTKDTKGASDTTDTSDTKDTLYIKDTSYIKDTQTPMASQALIGLSWHSKNREITFDRKLLPIFANLCRTKFSIFKFANKWPFFPRACTVFVKVAGNHMTFIACHHALLAYSTTHTYYI